jgi:hypothetical protein
VYWSGWDVVWKLMIAVLIGFVLLAIFKAAGVLTGQSLDLKAGSWVLLWLAGLTLLSWIGNYPEPAQGNLDKLTFTTSIPLVLLLSAVVYVAAYRMRLSDEEARAYIDESVTEAKVEDETLGAGH